MFVNLTVYIGSETLLQPKFYEPDILIEWGCATLSNNWPVAEDTKKDVTSLTRLEKRVT